MICISYSLTPYRKPVFYFIVSSYKLAGFVPILHTDCPQTSPEIPRFCPCLQPSYRSRTSRIFYATPRNCSEFSSEILPMTHKKSLEFYCQPASSSRHLHIRKIPATIIVTGTYKQILRFAQNDNASLRMTILSAWASLRRKYLYLLSAWATSTAHATVHPTIGLLPIPRKPIISTWAGTEDEPANCASLCIRPMVSVIP